MISSSHDDGRVGEQQQSPLLAFHEELLENARLRRALADAVSSYTLTPCANDTACRSASEVHGRWRALTTLARRRFAQLKRTVTYERLATLGLLPAVEQHARALGGIDLNIDLHDDYFSLDAVPLRALASSCGDGCVDVDECAVPCRAHLCRHRHGNASTRAAVDANVFLVLPDQRNTDVAERRAHALGQCAREKARQAALDVGWASEPAQRLQRFWQPSVTARVDVWVGPRAGSDVYIPPWELHSPLVESAYALDQFDEYLPRYTFEEKSTLQAAHGLADAVFVADNCAPSRRRVLLESLVARGYRFDATGKCLHNRAVDASVERQAREILTRAASEGRTVTARNFNFHLKMLSKAVLVSRYKFYFAFENSDEDHWITEKYATALAVGTVPVYFGSADARAFDPYLAAVVHVGDYARVDDLVTELRSIGGSAHVYAWHMQWRGLPVRAWNPTFLRLLRSERRRSLCSLCTVTAARHLLAAAPASANASNVRFAMPAPRRFDSSGVMLPIDGVGAVTASNGTAFMAQLEPADWASAALHAAKPMNATMLSLLLGRERLERAFPRRIYLDLGARDFDSSVGSWFAHEYPLADTFDDVYAFEAATRFRASYANASVHGARVHFLNVAVWTSNTTLAFGGAMGNVLDDRVDAHAAQYAERVDAIDFAAWLAAHVSARDFVMCKMDIELGEYTLVPHLIATNRLHLIDELFLECHYNPRNGIDPQSPHAAKRKADCDALLAQTRAAGSFAHQWG